MKASRLSLEQKVGQVFMFGFQGQSAEDAAYAVRDLKAGGIIYFARNLSDVRTTSALSRSLQDMAAGSCAAPLLIAADQEGGLVSRLTRGLPGMPGPMALAATGDPGLAERVSRAIGTQLRAAGVNVDLAPVLDVNDNPANPVIGVRSFASDPSVVAEFGRAAVRGLLASGVGPVGKHFPGHGNTAVDSHLDLPVLSQTMDRLDRVELAPFRAAISEGLPAIMTAHIVFRAIDPDNPATMSAPVLQGLLRHRMGFAGAIMTDCMEMQAVARGPGVAKASVRAFKAGADLVLISHTRELQVEAFNALLEAVRSGEVSEKRLNESVERVLSLKSRLGVPNPLDPGDADTPDMRALSRDAHRRSVTVLRSEPELLPLRRQQGSVAIVAATLEPSVHAGVVTTAAGATAAAALSEALRARGVSARVVPAAQAVTTEAKTGRATIVVTQNAWKDAGQAGAARKLIEAAPRAVVVAVRDPYDAVTLASARTFMCSYSPRPEAMEAVATVLTGEEEATGRLPVRLA